MKLTTVTITGADERTDPGRLLALTKRFPFVEWGILLSASSEGRRPRFPVREWMRDLCSADMDAELRLSGHLCGAWVRDLCDGGNSFIAEAADLRHVFDRLQLNFHAETHRIQAEPFVAALLSLLNGGFNLGEEFIFQIDDVNDRAMGIAALGLIKAVPLFDLSGGAGVLPSTWPVAKTARAGYAGGLSPENVVGQLRAIEAVAGDAEIWIDVETHVRTDDWLDLGKVERFLEAAAPFVADPLA